MDDVEVFDEGAGGLPGAVVSRRAVVAGMALAAMGLSGCGMGADDAGGSSVFADGSTGVVDVGSADADSVDVAEENSELSALHVDGTQLVDVGGAAVQLRGVSTHGLAWYPDYVNEDCFRQLHDEWGATVVRLALYTADSGGWCTDGDRDELRQVIDRGVQASVACGLYVIIDWHILSDGDPNTYVEEACDFFDEMSAAYADVPNVIYEICNEPNGDVSWDDVRAYAEEVLPHIRASAPDAVVLVGTPNWSQYVGQAAADPIAGDDNLMYTLHFYAATHKDDLRADLRSAVEGGLPVFVSEFGICDASGSGAIDEDSADAWVRLMDELGVSYVAWNLSNKDETSAMLSSSCSKTSGFDAEDLSDSGEWVAQTLSGTTVEEVEGESEDDDAASAGLTCDYVSDASWESDGKQFVKFQLTLRNGTEEAIDGWKLVVGFDREITLSDGWNGSYRASGKRLVVRNADYNGSVDAGGVVEDIGFIVGAETAPAIEGVDCSEA